MADEQKNPSQEHEEKCCGAHGKGCCCCRGRGRCLLTLLAVAAVAFGLFQAGRCSARHQDAAAVSAPAGK
jgi:hypothetical protein